MTISTVGDQRPWVEGVTRGRDWSTGRTALVRPIRQAVRPMRVYRAAEKGNHGLPI
jgi:hypothetical protein